MTPKKLLGKPFATVAGATCAFLVAAFCATVADASSSSFPPPGRIVYTAAMPTPGPVYGLFTAAADGTGARRITSQLVGSDRDPRWSPDGTQVAFTRDLLDPAQSWVWVVNADGTNPHRVSGEQETFVGYPKWSPDGRWIAFQMQIDILLPGGSPGTGYEVWLVRPDGSGLRYLDGSGFDGSDDLVGLGQAWAWSPDSRQIALTIQWRSATSPLGPPTINVVDLATGRKRKLTTGTYPVWSPDGSRIAFVDRCRIWSIPAKGGRRTPLTPRPKGQRCLVTPAWSPDGRWIATRDSYGKVILPLVTRYDGKNQHLARPIPPAAVRWPQNCNQLFFFAMPNLDPSTAHVGWIVHGPQGIPRYVGTKYIHANVGTNLDWNC